MLHQLKRHPIPMEAWFRDVLVLTYAVSPQHVTPLIPPGLELETHEHRAILAVALVQTEAMRPAGVPACLGGSFFLAGFRAFVRFRDAAGRTRRGLRILRSYADRRLLVRLGNLLTHYDYRLCRAEMAWRDDRLNVAVASGDGLGDLRATAHVTEDTPPLPDDSIFDDWRQARRFAGPLPFTFDHEPQTRSIIAIRGVRRHWSPRPVRVDVHHNTFTSSGPLQKDGAVLCSAFHLSGVPYRWERGVRHPLKRSER